MRDTPIIKAQDADIETLFGDTGIAKLRKGGKYPKDRRTEQRYQYLDMVTSFDIETSSHQFGTEVGDWESWMYIWQWQFGERVTVIGRTWEEFTALVTKINNYLLSLGNVRLMCYVHNLAYEMTFLVGIWNFAPDDIFATDVRAPLYGLMGQIELRCSYRLSGYSLDTWARELRTDHQKLVGNLDYRIERYPWTELTDAELAYCVHDVVAVVECVTTTLHSYGDTLYTIPYTQTGYIRRLVKAALKSWSPDAIRSMQNSLETYDHLREAFRGGDTHANRYWVMSILGDVHSYDRSSSYPDVMIHCKFPMTAFRSEKNLTFENFQTLVDSGRAVLLKVAFRGVQLRSERTGNPYIPYAKCIEPGFDRPINPKLDNGRILSADFCTMAMTDVDFEIVQKQYIWDDAAIEWMESARYGYLPQPMADIIIKLYKDKTELKGIKGKELVYMHSKQLINSCYGMLCQRLITNPITFENGEWKIADFDRIAEYDKVIEHAFGNYAWACWVTAWARYRLAQGIWTAEAKDKESKISAFVYADTDSVKCRGELDFTKFNEERIRDAKASGAWAVDPKGKPHYMGVFEDEGGYDFFGLWERNAIAQ